MSSPVFHPRQQKPRGTVWAARLIPGSSSGSHRRKQGPRALRDYLLVTLNWVLVAEISLRLHGVFPHMPMFSGSLLTSSISPTLLGIALLHGTLINLVSGPDGLRAEDTDLRTQMRTVGKAVFWATLVLSAALQLQGLSALAAALVWSAGILHFGTLLGRRWAER